MIDLTNVWMTDATVIAQINHVLASYAIILTVNRFTRKRWVVNLTSSLMATYALLKEFWYDATYEIPHQTFKDNMLDFSMYSVGILLALLIVKRGKK